MAKRKTKAQRTFSYPHLILHFTKYLRANGGTLSLALPVRAEIGLSPPLNFFSVGNLGPFLSLALDQALPPLFSRYTNSPLTQWTAIDGLRVRSTHSRAVKKKSLPALPPLKVATKKKKMATTDLPSPMTTRACGLAEKLVLVDEALEESLMCARSSALGAEAVVRWLLFRHRRKTGLFFLLQRSTLPIVSPPNEIWFCMAKSDRLLDKR